MLKMEGDRLFYLQHFDGARDMYSAALRGRPGVLECLANRAACCLKLGDYRCLPGGCGI